MTTQEIANQLVAYCRKGEWEAAQKQLYAKHAKSIEPYATPEFEKETTGLEAIIAKGHKFNALATIHSIELSDPLVAGNSIALTLTMDMTMKGQGRMTMPELCVYQVKDGKIICEEFFM